jgi:hypothetical protein
VPDRKVQQAASDAASRSINRDRAVQESRIRSATLVVPRKGSRREAPSRAHRGTLKGAITGVNPFNLDEPARHTPLDWMG